jgi:hypothetical protein
METIQFVVQQKQRAVDNAKHDIGSSCQNVGRSSRGCMSSQRGTNAHDGVCIDTEGAGRCVARGVTLQPISSISAYFLCHYAYLLTCLPACMSFSHNLQVQVWNYIEANFVLESIWSRSKISIVNWLLPTIDAPPVDYVR